MKKSVWSDSVVLPEFDKLQGEIKTDVLVIGGGMVGILCAKTLKDAGVDCVLVEGEKIASGITKNTTAKITSQHGLIYNKIIKDYGKEKAKMYLDANNKALESYEKLCLNIDCDYETKDAYTYSLDNRKKIEQEVEAVASLGCQAEFVNETELPFEISAAIKFQNQAQFNPLKFVSKIVRELKVYEDTFIYDITPNIAISKNGKIRAKQIIVATHFPFINKHGSYFLKLYQHRSYVTAYERIKQIKGMYVDEDKRGLSFRSYKDLLLIGGGGHRTGKQGGAWKEIESFSQKYYHNAQAKYQWATQDCESLDGIPYIGHYSKKTPNFYVATGFNKWGMTSSMVAAQILTDMILGKNNDTKEVFSPHRSILKPQLLVNGLETTKNLLTPTVKRCPHLGCALKWNKAERTWDCPCHGSRFEKNGKLIDNPATGDADIKNDVNY
jgi:glycine/D-amino acid oxidase-like deaminating enzyme